MDDELAAFFNARDDAWKVGMVFMACVVEGNPPQEILALVTPESERQWGDFAAARELLGGRSVTTGIDYPAPGVAYMRLPEATETNQVFEGDELIVARIITLVRHPERGWLVHHVGGYVRPEVAPRYE